MKKHLVIAALVCSMLVLSACGSKKDKQNEAMIDGIANEDCSNYVSYLTCIADQLGES
jgi:protein involved in sex pheromone biosynthesis